MSRMFWKKYLIVTLAAWGLSQQVAAAQEYPVDGSNYTISCSGNVLATGKKWGSYPTTVTGCVLASDTGFAIGSGGLTFGVTCKAGGMIEFYPDSSRVKYCTLALDVPRAYNTSGQMIECKGDALANFTPEGKVSQCGAQPPAVTVKPPVSGGDNIISSGSSNIIVVPGESGTISGAGRYTHIAKSSPRSGGRGGFVYLGDGGARANYTVKAGAGQYQLWIRFDDDGKHAAGARAVDVWVNGAKALIWSNPSQDTKGWVNIRIGTVNLKEGLNSIAFTKSQTTSAAFVMDEFALTPPGKTPQ